MCQFSSWSAVTAGFSRLEVRHFHQRGVENEALRVADVADRFDRAVIRCLTERYVKRTSNQ